MENRKNLILWCTLTLILSMGGSWVAMNARIYEVEARIRLIEADNTSTKIEFKDHIKEGAFIRESLVRIEGKLDLKQDRFK